MAAERLTKSLKDLGLREEEAEMYVFISAMGPTPVRAVARKFNLNRMRIYRSLKALEEKKLVQRVMGRPVKFVATPMRSVIDQRIGVLRQNLSGLEENAESIVSEWKRLSSDTLESSEEPRFRIYQGRQNVFDLLFEMVERSGRVIRLVTTTNDLSRFALAGLDDKLKAMKRSGVEVRILTQIDAGSLDVVGQYAKSFDLRHINLKTPIRFAITDEKEALNTITMDDSMNMTTQTDMGLWTDASNYVAAQRTFFDALWSLADDANSVIRFIQTGTPKPEMKTFTTQEDYNSTFHDMIGRAFGRIDLLAKNITTLPTTLSELEEKTRKGVDIRLLIHTELENIHEIDKIVKKNIINISENAVITDLVLLIVDQKEALMNIPHAETQKWALWSNINTYVETSTIVFNDYWNLSKPIKEKLEQIDRLKRIDFVAAKIRERFEEKGWTVEVPGTLTGVSWKTYMFDVLAKNPDKTGVNLCIDVITEGPVFNKIIERSTLYSDLVGSMVVLASLVKCRPEELQLAELYQIKIVYAETPEEIVSSF
ncbi:TPA: hypothetical protein HA344_04370 [Candidatus Bathyarchaeota archaeon]|nr:hypothetical protein [Candidatus Bathyarchaeota archaeon]